MTDGISIGPRLQQLRNAHGMTQRELAERADVSIDVISKLERGARHTARLTTITRLAKALDEDTGSLTGKGNRVERVGDLGVLAVRNAITSPDLLPGLDPDDDGAPSDPTDLHRQVEKAYGAYFEGEFGALAAQLPGLLSECRLTRSAMGPSSVAAAYAHAYQLAACLLVHVGKDDAALIGAERGMAAATEGDDEYRAATLSGTYVWILLRMGRYAEAERLAVRTASGIEPTYSTTDPRQLTAWGGQLLHAAVIAGADERGDEALEYLSRASAAAARMGSDRHDYWVSFGPSQVAMQRAHVQVSLDEPDEVLAAAAAVKRSDLFPISWARHSLNVAQALERKRMVDDAIAVAARAYEISPQWFRHQQFAASVISDLVGHKQRLPRALQTMASTVSTAEE
ncbi:helix-turn-helix domain-containing protein [Streptomonospora litoralis]|uniref:Anaerobic benzoate catabolism transcriptional regulator n=1 Tax=Streptomonospora litoralis TaxID=2498135 RepID=A0A4P6Q2D1_9ACTN|nr:helix-turn-helix transcriptional regulator [Streptomonospora litoralis]QBI53401.1 anaerobic benzoate catabolism transcriptional regulator [Streptomonospora litoralis]